MSGVVLKPEIEPDDYVVQGKPGKGKVIWKVQERTNVHATIKEIWIGTMAMDACEVLREIRGEAT
jgi:hypothetical protein